MLETTGALMAGVKGRSGPPGNQNNFKHGLFAIQKRREAGVITEHEETLTQNRIEWRSEQRTSTLGPQIDHVSSETIN